MHRVGRLMLFLTVLLAVTAPQSAFASGSEPPPSSGTQEPAVQKGVSPADKAAALRRSAEESYEAGWKEIDKAIELLEEATALADSKDTKEVEKAAKNRESAVKRYNKAIDKFRKATELAADYHEAWNMLGYSYRKTGQLGKAFKAYETCLKLSPDYEPAHEYLGEAHLQAGDLEKAKEQLVWLKERKSEEAEKLEKAIESYESGKSEALPSGGW